MKKMAAALLALGLTISASTSVFALGFTGELGNEATFETLLEAHESAPEVVANIMENSGTYVGHPCLEAYPDGTTFVYRSANQYGGRAAARLNSNIIVAAEKHFETKDEALEYLKSLGVIDIIDKATGSVVLITPEGETFGQTDVKDYYALQTAMLAQKDGGTDADGNSISYADAEYFGGYGYVYFVGVDGGATFFNNYLAIDKDFVGRIAGVLLVGGDMQEIRKVDECGVPVFLVNAPEEVAEKYKAANGVNAEEEDATETVWYNQESPLKRVVEMKDADTSDLSVFVDKAYSEMFVKTMRVPVLPQALSSGGAAFSGYNFDEAPYSLCDRSVVVDGETEDGIVMISHQMDDDRFKEYATTEDAQTMGGDVIPAGEYIDVWYEYLPKEAVDGTAPEHSIPLILANHGGGDDARVFVEEFGLLELAGKERIALVAPDHQNIGEVRGPALTAIVEYMLEKYPALDPSRVYATGYSMGGGATYTVGYYDPTMFAAIAPCAGSPTELPEDEAANFDGVELPIIMTLTSFDSLRRLDAMEGNINEAEQGMVSLWTKLNGIELPAYDFESYPHLGFKPDKLVVDTVNNEFEKDTYYMNDEEGRPVYAFSFIKGMIHALYPKYADIVWDFMKHYSRNTETGEVIYNAYVD